MPHFYVDARTAATEEFWHEARVTKSGEATSASPATCVSAAIRLLIQIVVLQRSWLIRAGDDAMHQTDASFLVVAQHVLQHRGPVLAEDDVQAER
jgi:hypothetical protein